jgi:hypothetical protein
MWLTPLLTILLLLLLLQLLRPCLCRLTHLFLLSVEML